MTGAYQLGRLQYDIGEHGGDAHNRHAPYRRPPQLAFSGLSFHHSVPAGVIAAASSWRTRHRILAGRRISAASAIRSAHNDYLFQSPRK